jgi:hypothetical protein
VTVYDFGNQAPPPINDACQNCIPLNPNLASLTFSGSTVGATPDGSSTCDSGSLPDVWFCYMTCASNVTVTLDTCGSAFDTVLSVHFACPGTPLNEVVCNDDDSIVPCAPQSRVTFVPDPSTTYYIRIAGKGGAVGNYKLNLSLQPLNDDCAQAIPIPIYFGSFSATIDGLTLGGNPTPPGVLIPPPCGLSAASPDVYYAITPQCSGPVILRTCPPCPKLPPFDTVLSVYVDYTGTCAQLTQLTGKCNDDDPPQPAVSAVPIQLIAGLQCPGRRDVLRPGVRLGRGLRRVHLACFPTPGATTERSVRQCHAHHARDGGLQYLPGYDRRTSPGRLSPSEQRLVQILRPVQRRCHHLDLRQHIRHDDCSVPGQLPDLDAHRVR